MKIVAINGSPKGGHSNTRVMIDAMTSGFSPEKHEVVKIDLSEHKIGYCKGCYSCWTVSPGKCCQNDDMHPIVDSVRDADVLVLGSPLYFNNISGTLKVCIDRLTALGGNPHAAKKDPGQKVGIIFLSNCGFPVREQFAVVSLWINHFTRMLNGNLLGEFYATNGKLLTSSNPEDVQVKDRYVGYLAACSRSFEKEMKLTEDLSSQLTKPITEF